MQTERNTGYLKFYLKAFPGWHYIAFSCMASIELYPPLTRHRSRNNEHGNTVRIKNNNSTLRLLDWPRGCSLPGFTGVSPSTGDLYGQIFGVSTLAPRVSVAANQNAQDGYTLPISDSDGPRPIVGLLKHTGTLPSQTSHDSWGTLPAQNPKM